MPFFVALEIQKTELLVAVARSAAKRMQFEQTFSIPIANGQTDVELGELLKKSLSRSNVAKCDAVAIVSRRDAEIREINVPPAPDDELSEMVKFRSRSEFGSLNENWLLDYVPFSDDSSVPRDVLAVAVAPEITGRLVNICETANLKLKHVLFRPFAVVDLFRSKLLDGECRLIVDKSADAIDLTVTRGANILSMRSVKAVENGIEEERVKQLAGEALRTIASVSKRLDGAEVKQVILCQNDELLATELAERLNAKVETIDAFESVPRKSRLERPKYANRLSAVLGALLQHDTQLGHEIDFLNPRRKIVKTTNYRRYATIGLAALAGFLVLSLLGWWVLTTQKNEIQTMTKQRADLQEKNAGEKNGVSVDKSSKQIIGEVGKVDEWKTNDINWLDELYEVSDRYLTPDDAIVDSFEASLRRDVSQIKLMGRSAGADSEKKLKEGLMNRPFGLNSPGTKMTGDETYPQSYEFILFPRVDKKSVIDQMDQRAREYRANSRAKDLSTDNASSE